MYFRLIVSLSLFFNAQAMMAQEEFVHYYLKIDGSKTEKFDLDIGIIDFDADHNPTRRQIEAIGSLSQLKDAIYTSLNEENTSNQLNIFIHGINSNYNFAWYGMMKNLSSQVYTHKDGKQKVILSIIWDSSINYFKGSKIARKKGDYLAAYIKNVITSQDDKTEINFLCHSMGNRIFQHMMVKSNLISEGNKVINQYVSVGADVEAEIFDKGEPLDGISSIIDFVTIYVHNNDRSLKLSKLVNRTTRLGLQGLDPNKMPHNFRIVDVSTITDQLNFKSRMTNHLYFYLSPAVMYDINKLIWTKDFITNKKELEHPRRLKLIP